MSTRCAWTLLEAARGMLALAALAVAGGCPDHALPVVDLGETVASASPHAASVPVLRLAVGAMTSPEATFTSYIDLMHLLEVQLGGSATLVLRRSYGEINALLLRGEVDVAFICSGAYVKLVDEGDVELLAVPLVDGRPHYRSDIIARRERGARDFAELRGLRFAFTDPLSNTGRYYPMHLLQQMSEQPATFFSAVVFTGGHDTSIAAVQDGLVDAAAVDSLIFDHLQRTNPERVRDLWVVQHSPDFPIPPVVVRAGFDALLKQRVRETLLALHTLERGQGVLRELHVDRFVQGDAADYLALQQMIRDVDRAFGAPR